MKCNELRRLKALKIKPECELTERLVLRMRLVPKIKLKQIEQQILQQKINCKTTKETVLPLLLRKYCLSKLICVIKVYLVLGIRKSCSSFEYILVNVALY